MPDQWEIETAIHHLRIARYLMSRADEKGYTHGEKHHIIQVCLAELVLALSKLGDTRQRFTDLNANTDPSEASDIPF